jgi:hypothetical protein
MPELPPTEPAPERACAHCGAPQDEQQEICVECGTPVRTRRAAARLRPALRPLVLALFAVLLVTSAAYGLTADLGRKPDRLRQLAVVPTTTTPAPAPAPAPPATTPAPTPPDTTPAPAPPAPAAKPAAPAPSTPSPAPSSPSAIPAPNPSPTPSHHTHKSPTPAKPHHNSSSAPAWLKQGDQPYSATLHDPYSDGTTDEHASTAGKAVDGKVGTAWTTADHPGGLGKPGVGLVIEASGYQSYSALGIQTATAGFSVSIYSTDQSDPPATGPADGGWKLEGSKSSVAKQQRITLKGATAQPQYLLVWITKLPSGKPRAGLSEISLLP